MPSHQQPDRRWSRAPLPDEWEELAAAGYPPWLAALLARRGVSDAQEAETFLQPALDHLHAPGDLPGIFEAVERLEIAREKGEKVAIVGDYDVDGVSATALLTAVLEAAGVEVRTILPNRLEEGYGFQVVHVDRAQEADCSLIVTADCGTTADEAIEAALHRGLSVIVTDHHLPVGDLPPGIIEVNPKREPGAYPFLELAGAGVALKLAVQLAEQFEVAAPVEALLRVACLGTICDLVPLVGENRTIAALGLAALGKTRSVGLQELLRRADVRMPVSSTDVGFRLGPRLNAAGRMARPDEALELLMTRDRKQAASLAAQLDDWNRSRQQAETRVVEEALEALAKEDLPWVVVAWSDEWHPGVVGIAAGRIARQLHRPTLLFSVEGEWATGSGRSIRGIHLHDFLGGWSERYERFGGHAQAIGIKVATRELESLRADWAAAAVNDWDEELLAKSLSYELEMEVGELDSQLVAALQRLAPFGMGNRQPVLRVGPLTANGKPRIFGKGHLALSARGDEGSVIELLGWGWQARAADLEGRFEALGCLEEDSYTKKPVLRLVDVRAWGTSDDSSPREGLSTHRMKVDG